MSRLIRATAAALLGLSVAAPPAALPGRTAWRSTA